MICCVSMRMEISVIIELKRDKTPREITSQVLDYASWIKELLPDEINEQSVKYFIGKGNSQTLSDAFQAKFDARNS